MACGDECGQAQRVDRAAIEELQECSCHVLLTDFTGANKQKPTQSVPVRLMTLAVMRHEMGVRSIVPSRQVLTWLIVPDILASVACSALRSLPPPRLVAQDLCAYNPVFDLPYCVISRTRGQVRALCNNVDD